MKLFKSIVEGMLITMTVIGVIGLNLFIGYGVFESIYLTPVPHYGMAIFLGSIIFTFDLFMIWTCLEIQDINKR